MAALIGNVRHVLMTCSAESPQSRKTISGNTSAPAKWKAAHIEANENNDVCLRVGVA